MSILTLLSNKQYRIAGLPKWSAALNRVKKGQGNAKVLCIGDSTTWGAYSNDLTSGDWVGGAFPARLANELNAVLPATQNSWFGSDNGSSLNAKMSMGAGWSTSSAGTMGNKMLLAPGTGTTTTYTPAGNVDTFDIYVITGSGLGVLSYQIDSETAQTFDEGTGTNGVVKLTVTTTLGAHALKLKWSSGGNVYILGVTAYNSAQKQILVCNAGWNGSSTADWLTTGSPWSPVTMLPTTFGQDLTIINLGINEWYHSAGTTTYATNMQTLLSVLLPYSDVLIMSPVPSAEGATPLATQQTYVDALKEVAASNNVPVLDTFSRWVSWDAGNALGYYATCSPGVGNNLHPRGQGYQEIGAAMKKALVNNSGFYVFSAPVNSVSPVVSGNAWVGSTLTSSTGTWLGGVAYYTYQWRRDGVAIPSATASGYTTVTADIGTSIDCVVTAANMGGTTSLDSNNITVTEAVSFDSRQIQIPDYGVIQSNANKELQLPDYGTINTRAV